ncbi:MAG TPA: CRISPR-associated endonuclease Cas1 [Candidatus Baltobacteraceae bacterium]|jgi:CRISPR-associated protein Cas1|nr:CRISPR-associated endonuclease Cas1 [Candidatus Baltobacteraceae bacterium]
MNDKDPSASSENRLSEPESSPTPRGVSPSAGGARLGGEREAIQKTGDPKQVKIVLRIEAVESQLASVAQPAVETPAPELPQSPPSPSRQETEPQQIPARMLNEFVYCQRLFYYEFVEGVFVESVDTLRGEAIHKRVDSGNGALPAAKKKSKKTTQDEPPETVDATAQEPEAQNAGPETIHSRSVQMGSERLGVVAKMDLVESKTGKDDLLTALEVCPVDYKAGAPKEGEEANELWDTDKMQLGLQALILRDNGYACDEGVIYYRASKQRVRLPITPELENWILQNIAEAKRVITGPIPAPLIHSPKCVRCSLAPVCLPDETRMLAQSRAAIDLSVGEATDTPEDSKGVAGEPPRRLIAARDDTRPLYLNTQGYRVGCKDEVLTVKEKDRVVEEVRMRDLSHVALFGNIQISTQAIQSLCEQEIPVTYFSMGGWFYGITRGHALKNVFLRMEQFRFARDETVCLSLARQFVHGKIRNHRTLLMRNHLEPPEPIILKLKRASEDALAAASIAELLGIEGAAASQYFQQFSGMVKVEDDDLPGLEMPGKNAKQLAFNFNFTNRNRRPPTDPVNAMLSLAYSMLAKDCTLAALAVGFDPYIGFYHQPRFGRPALGLDLMEEMRPLVAESTVLSCINNRVVTEKDFVRAGQAVNLTAPGRKRFFQMYEQRMSSLITHPLFDYKVSYRRALELQARLLAKTLTGEIAEYIPLLTR